MKTTPNRPSVCASRARRAWPALALCLLSATPLAAQQADSASDHDGAGSLIIAQGVRPGDVIRVWVWREPDYSGDFTVDARGEVVLPLLGEVSVPGRTAEQLSDSLRQAYRQYLNNPSIQITVLRRVAVAGEVVKPGLYPADATITIGDLITLAGGVTSNADRNKIELMRDGKVIVSRLGPGTVLQNSPVQSGDQIFVPLKSWFARNGNIFLYGLVTAGATILARIVVQ